MIDMTLLKEKIKFAKLWLYLMKLNQWLFCPINWPQKVWSNATELTFESEPLKGTHRKYIPFYQSPLQEGISRSKSFRKLIDVEYLEYLEYL